MGGLRAGDRGAGSRDKSRAESRAIKRQGVWSWKEKRGEFRSYGVRGNWQQRLRQLRRYTIRKIRGLGMWGIDLEGADAL